MDGDLMALFEDFFEDVVGVEGGFVDDKRDSGGATRYGITEAVARANGYNGPMSALPLSLAKNIYKGQYWDALSLDSLSNLCPDLCMKLADISVNMGTKQAGFFLQRLLNVFNDRGRLYPDIRADGVVGQSTIGTLRKFLSIRQDGEMVLIRALNCMQGSFYISLAERREKDEAFIYGWLRNRIQ